MSRHPTDPITQLTATAIAAEIRACQVSSREVVDAHIARIEDTHAELNAVVMPMFDEARREADRADEAVRRGDTLGPLHGVPVTIKDMFDVAGMPTTAGLLHRQETPAESDAVMVTRLRNAGAVILGKTNVPQMGLMIETDNPVYGRTNNPCDIERSPGGSSGGEAAIVAAHGSPLGLGSDGGGSIRQPVHATGVCGFKPTSGRLTMRGHWRYPAFPSDFAQPGPIARSVDDLELAMQVFASPEPVLLDPQIAPGTIRDSRVVDLSTLRIAMFTDDGYLPASPAIRRGVEASAAVLRDCGATVEPWTPPDVERVWRLFFALMYADGGMIARRQLGRAPRDARINNNLWLTAIPNVLRPLLRSGLRLTGQPYLSHAFKFVTRRSVGTGTYLDLIEERNAYRNQFLRELESHGFDAIICPPCAVPAPKHGRYLVSYAVLYTVLFNALGMPAGVLPATRVRPDEESDRKPSRDAVTRTFIDIEQGSAGLPVGVQVAGRHWREDVVLAIMRQLEKVAAERLGA